MKVDKPTISDFTNANHDHTTVAQGGTLPIYAERELIAAISDETTDLTQGTAKLTFRWPCDAVLTKIPRANVNTAPVGSTIQVDINRNGSSILSTVISIDASEKTSVTAATPAVLSQTIMYDDDEIVIDLDQVGSGTAGKGAKVTFYYRREYYDTEITTTTTTTAP